MKVMILEIPSFDSLLEKFGGLVEEAKKPATKVKKNLKSRFFIDEEEDDDDEDEFECEEPPAPWKIGGKPADENLRFGYGLHVDEPRKQDFEDWDEFLEAREAFDDFVDAGERCVELGLEKTNDAPITKCQAIRKKIGCPPPMDVDLLGESQFPWWEKGFEW